MKPPWAGDAMRAQAERTAIRYNWFPIVLKWMLDDRENWTVVAQHLKGLL